MYLIIELNQCFFRILADMQSIFHRFANQINF